MSFVTKPVTETASNAVTSQSEAALSWGHGHKETDDASVHSTLGKEGSLAIQIGRLLR
jgi:hypothetical protein